MAFKTLFIELFIPIENIEAKYPGGFKQYVLDNSESMAYDSYLVMKGAMSPWDMESHVRDCEAFGLGGEVEGDGVLQWRDFFVVEGEPTLPCEWLRQDGALVYHKDDVVEVSKSKTKI